MGVGEISNQWGVGGNQEKRKRFKDGIIVVKMEDKEIEFFGISLKLRIYMCIGCFKKEFLQENIKRQRERDGKGFGNFGIYWWEQLREFIVVGLQV